ncbi:MAG: hypothetical protein ABEH78_09935 [Haloferacaceae archaeon]
MGKKSEGANAGAGEVVASVDRSGSVPLVVIADISADDAWISILESEAPDLAKWR